VEVDDGHVVEGSVEEEAGAIEVSGGRGGSAEEEAGAIEVSGDRMTGRGVGRGRVTEGPAEAAGPVEDSGGCMMARGVGRGCVVDCDS
jgi:hypothetical protein